MWPVSGVNPFWRRQRFKCSRLCVHIVNPYRLMSGTWKADLRGTAFWFSSLRGVIPEVFSNKMSCLSHVPSVRFVCTEIFIAQQTSTFLVRPKFFTHSFLPTATENFCFLFLNNCEIKDVMGHWGVVFRIRHRFLDKNGKKIIDYQNYKCRFLRCRSFSRIFFSCTQIDSRTFCKF